MRVGAAAHEVIDRPYIKLPWIANSNFAMARFECFQNTNLQTRTKGTTKGSRQKENTKKSTNLNLNKQVAKLERNFATTDNTKRQGSKSSNG